MLGSLGVGAFGEVRKRIYTPSRSAASSNSGNDYTRIGVAEHGVEYLGAIKISPRA
jgi:hypothetical protein